MYNHNIINKITERRSHNQQNGKYLQGNVTVQKAKGVNPQHSFMGMRDLGRVGCPETKA
jgi:hypothetical protein